MRCKKNGMGIQAGYTVYSADVYQCPVCGGTVAVGMSRHGVSADEWAGPVIVLEVAE